MPRGVYEKTRLYRKTSKLTEGLTALKSQDPYYQITELTTNDEVFSKLKELGFTYNGQQWHMSKRPKMSRNSSNGNSQQPLPLEVDNLPITITPIAPNRLEMCLREDDLGTVQSVIDAMHTLGFKVQVKIVGTR